MGNNTKPYDHDAQLNAKTTRELEELRKWWEERKGGPADTLAREQIALIKLKIAERIGRKT